MGLFSTCYYLIYVHLVFGCKVKNDDCDPKSFESSITDGIINSQIKGKKL